MDQQQQRLLRDPIPLTVNKPAGFSESGSSFLYSFIVVYSSAFVLNR